MSDASGDESLARLAAELARSLRDLQRELDERDNRLRPPTAGELLRFTDEVAIPAAILVLETNIRALRLLQRALRIADGRDPRGGAGQETPVRDRAVELSQTTLERLDTVLVDVQDAIEGRPPDDEARDLLREARELRDDIEARLAAEQASDPTSEPRDAVARELNGEETDVPVDVESELEALKDDVDGDDDTDDTT